MNRWALRTAAILVVLLFCLTTSALAQSSSATFVGLDTHTQGNWHASYGAEGYSLSNSAQNLPGFDPSFSVQNGQTWTWAASTSDPRALQIPGGSIGIAATWFSLPSFALDVNLTDGLPHKVSLYALDWDSRGRAENIQVVDANTYQVLDQQTLSTFANGVYLAWNISGHVKINVTSTSGPNAVVSGIFFGGSSLGTIHVPGDQPTIQAAINAAVNGTTVLVAPGTYNENINFNGKAITVTSVGGPSVTKIDGGSNGTVVTFNSGEGANSTLSGFTIQNGLSSIAGGGVYISASSPTITGNTITHNRASVGLGIYVNGGSPLIQNNLITENNSQYGDGGPGGGGILISGGAIIPALPMIIGNTITNNSVALGGDGGGISITYFSNPTIRGNFIAGNTAYNFGGGIAVQDYNGAIIIQNIILSNTSLAGGSGAGLYVSTTQGTASTIVDNTIAGNNATDQTSGVYISGFPQLINFANNIVAALGTQKAVTYDSSYSNVSAAFSYNDFYSGGQQPWSGSCDLTTNPGNISADALFVNPNVNNFHLQPGSPAINVGNNTAPQVPAADFDGNHRVLNGTIDLGAFEYQGLTTALLSPTSLTFQNQPIQASSQPLSITVTNSGATALQISSIATTGSFSETDTCQTSTGIAVGQSCQINIVFTPSAPGFQSGQLTVTANTSTSPQTLSLNGTGVTGTVGNVATFAGSDSATGGNWQSRYGAEGYSIANGAQSLPVYDPSFALQNQQSWTWVPATTDPRALRIPNSTGGMATTWYNAQSFSFNINFTDGQTHQIALYALDWDGGGRSETIQVLDAATNSPISGATLSISNFTNGTYLLWNISGHVKIVLTEGSGPNTVISGIFFGSAGTPSAPNPILSITKTHTGNFAQAQHSATYTVTVLNQAGAGPTSGPVTVTESVPSGLALASMAGTGWTCPANATTCTRSDALSGGSSYPPIIVTVSVTSTATSPQVNQVSVSGGGSVAASANDSTTITSGTSGGPSVQFSGADVTTQGNWQRKYGSDGYYVINGYLPSSISGSTASSVNGNPYTWAANTSDPRALENSSSGPAGPRIASTWYNSPSFNFDVNFTDGNTHQFALYALDWDFGGRVETITVVDPNSNNAVLDTRTISHFTGGTYLIWNISGHVKIVVTSNAGSNAVVSGVFLDHTPIHGVVYTLTGATNTAFGPVHAESFQFTAPGFITSEIDLSASQLVSCVACYQSGTAVQFFPNGTASTVVPVDYIRFTDANGIIYGFFFAPGTFSAPGTYSTSDFPPYIISNIGTLTVQVAP